jgi:arylsulfatase A-like enzyme
MAIHLRPNILFILTDQQRWDTTGIHGNPLALTPNFDRIAQEGTHLFNTFTCQPVCTPARACLQTGMYATQSGVYRNGLPLPPDSQTIAKHLHQAGYNTAYIGKWHLGTDEMIGPVPDEYRGGYEYWLASNVLEFTSDAYQVTLYDNEQRPNSLPGYRVDALADAAIRYIDANQTKPFFLFLSFLEPHFQNHRDDYPAPDGYAERTIGQWIPPDLAALGGSSHQHISGYYGMVRKLDEALGRLLDALKSLRLVENTIVIFTSDHGNHFKTRNAEYKRSGHESSIRVPAAITGPGFFGGGRIQNLVSLIDIPPTILDACGIQISPQMQGHSFLPLIQHQPVSWPKEVFIQISESQVGRAIRTKRWKYGVVAPNGDGWSEMDSTRYRDAYLYDLLSDPYELTNLIKFISHQEVADSLRKRLIQRMVLAGETAPIIEPNPDIISNPMRIVYPEEIDD